jgi:hypothetical protein
MSLWDFQPDSLLQRGIDGSQTLRWRKEDSNSGPSRKGRVERSNTLSCQPGEGQRLDCIRPPERRDGGAHQPADPSRGRRGRGRSHDHGPGRVPIIRRASSRASAAAPLNRSRIAPVPMSRNCRSSLEHGFPATTESGSSNGRVRNRATGAAFRGQASLERQRPFPERQQCARPGVRLRSALAARPCSYPKA